MQFPLKKIFGTIFYRTSYTFSQNPISLKVMPKLFYNEVNLFFQKQYIILNSISRKNSIININIDMREEIKERALMIIYPDLRFELLSVRH